MTWLRKGGAALAYFFGFAFMPLASFAAFRAAVERFFESRAVALPAEPFASVTGAAAACFAFAVAIAIRSFIQHRRST